MGTRTATSSCRKWAPAGRVSARLRHAGPAGRRRVRADRPGPALARGDAGPIGHEVLRGEAEEAARALEDRTAAATLGNFQLGEITLPYDGASVGVVALDPRGLSAEEAVRLADTRMYVVKRRARARA